MRHFIVVEENADRLYKKTYFFNEILKIQFFPTNCFSNTAKAVEIKIISPMNFCSDRILCLSKNQSLKAVNPQKKCEQYHFFTEKCIFLKKIHTLIILAMPNGSTIFLCKRVVLLTFFLRNNSFKALIFAQAKTLITTKVHRRDDFDVNSFCCI